MSGFFGVASKDDCVLEIGPGIGTMTQYLAEAAGKVVAVPSTTLRTRLSVQNLTEMWVP